MLETLASFAKCSITKQVYHEILKGKEKLYEDAFDIERIVGKGRLAISEAKVEEVEGLGIGECSVLSMFQKTKGDAIISDDRKFLSILESRNIPFVIQTDIIVMLAIKKCVSKSEAMKALDRIRQLVREESYDAAKRSIGGR